MKFYILFSFILPTAYASLTWYDAPVYEIKEDLFKKKVIDSYEANIQSSSPTLHEPTAEVNSKNPYKSNLTRFAIYNSDFGVAPIPVYNLEGDVVKSINDIFVECYDLNDCHYQLTEADRQELSLYASYIENSGIALINTPYSLGVIRSKFTTSVLGMYTQGFEQLDNQIGFWIRLEDGEGKRMYTNLGIAEKLTALLDLSVHERSHFDQPTYNSNAAHCDNFQSNYNYLFQLAARQFEEYKLLTNHITEYEEVWVLNTFETVLVIVSSLLFLILMFTLIWNFMSDPYIPVAKYAQPLNY